MTTDQAPGRTTAIWWWYGGDDGEVEDIGVYLVRTLTSPTTDELRTTMEQAIRDFLQTKAGQDAILDNNGSFCWGDAINLIPDNHWILYGIVAIDFLACDQELIVNHDEDFVPDLVECTECGEEGPRDEMESSSCGSLHESCISDHIAHCDICRSQFT